MNTTILQEYYDKKNKMAELDAEIKAMQPEIAKLIAGTKDKELELEGLALFTLKTYTTYEYSTAVKVLEKKLKIQKSNEEADGTAKVVTSKVSPMMRKAKE